MKNALPLTEEIIEMDKAHHLRPYLNFDTLEEGALPIERAEGIYVWDTDGKKYVDAIGGMWCTNIGAGSKEMADAIAQQILTCNFANPFTDMTNVPATRLTKKLAELAPGDLNHVHLTCGGSTANDSAFRLVQFYHACKGNERKKHILSRTDAYHGTTYVAMSLGGKKGDRIDEMNYMGPEENIHHLSSPNYYRYGNGLSEADFAHKLFDEFIHKIDELGGPDTIAAFLAEPIMGTGGVVLPPGNYLKRIADYCRQHDILYWSDEVVTGFGRCGEWFVSEAMFDIQPDILISAKGLSSAYIPLGACIFSDRIWDVISEPGHGRYFAHGYTYSSHTVAAAAALKNIEIMEREKILDHVRKVGPYFLERLGELHALDMVGDVRGTHLMACVEFVKDKNTGETFPEEMDIGKLVSNEADRLGLIVRPMVNLNVMSPSLICTEQDIDFIVDTLRQAIEVTSGKLRNRGAW